MSGNIWSALYTFLEQIWRFFNSFYFPGTKVTPAGILFLPLFVGVVIRFIRRVFKLTPEEK